MPAAQGQRAYNFYDGAELLKRSVQFTRYMKRHYESATARRLGDATALDYGAGWGRIARMLLQFVPADGVYACDADPTSVALYNGWLLMPSRRHRGG